MLRKIGLRSATKFVDMTKRKPLKRIEELKPISRDHHFSLLLCWKIKTAFSKQISPDRVKRYVDWFYQEHILEHFELEENYVFPVLGKESELVLRALQDHKRLKVLFEQDGALIKNLRSIENELEQHIRFEERVLFEKIQEVASEKELKTIELNHSSKIFKENTDDVFWM